MSGLRITVDVTDSPYCPGDLQVTFQVRHGGRIHEKVEIVPVSIFESAWDKVIDRIKREMTVAIQLDQQARLNQEVRT